MQLCNGNCAHVHQETNLERCKYP